MFLTCEFVGAILCFLSIAYSASLSKPRFFTGIFLDAVADDMVGGSPKDTSSGDPITWNRLDDYYYENDYYEDIYDNKHRRSYRNKKRLSQDIEDPLGALLRRNKSHSNFDDDDEEGDVDDGYDEDGYNDDDTDVENLIEIRSPQRTSWIRNKNSKQSNERSNEDDDEDEDETDDGYEDENGYDDENEGEDNDEDETEDEEDDDSEENIEQNQSNSIKNNKRKEIKKNTEENNALNEQPDAEGNIFIELKDDEKVETSVVKIENNTNKKKVKKDQSDNDENNDEDDEEEDDDEVQEDSDESDEENDDDNDSYEERSVRI